MTVRPASKPGAANVQHAQATAPPTQAKNIAAASHEIADFMLAKTQERRVSNEKHGHTSMQVVFFFDQKARGEEMFYAPDTQAKYGLDEAAQRKAEEGAKPLVVAQLEKQSYQNVRVDLLDDQAPAAPSMGGWAPPSPQPPPETSRIAVIKLGWAGQAHPAYTPSTQPMAKRAPPALLSDVKKTVMPWLTDLEDHTGVRDADLSQFSRAAQAAIERAKTQVASAGDAKARALYFDGPDGSFLSPPPGKYVLIEAARHDEGQPLLTLDELFQILSNKGELIASGRKSRDEAGNVTVNWDP